MVEDKRRYIRLGSVFPVEFSLYFTQQKPVSLEYEAFTSNVSEGGLCLTVRNLKPEDEGLILRKKAGLKLVINIPLWSKPINATAQIAWVQKNEKDSSGKTYFIGVSYQDIKERDRKKIVNYARRLKWLPRIAATTLLVLFISFFVLSLNHIKIKKENESLIKQFVSAAEVKSNIERQLNELKIRKEMLEAEFLTSEKEKLELEEDITGIEAKTDLETKRLAKELDRALAEQKSLKNIIARLSVEKKMAQDMIQEEPEGKLAVLKEKIDALKIELSEVTSKGKEQIELLQNRLKDLGERESLFKKELFSAQESRVSLEEQLARLRAKSTELEKASIDTMVNWVRIRQVKKTGLVLSYEGDKEVKDWGFTYGQALASQLFLISGEQERAKAILTFYRDIAKCPENLFYNAYDVKSSSPCEYTIHSGPNIWIAISACQYTYRTKDKQFLNLAESIAGAMIKMQKASEDGSIKGGPKVNWVSTEHNLDAYALFNMLYKLTGKEIYQEAASVTLLWLKDVGYNKPEKRFMRGKGDSTIATDTFSWAIASIGPETLKANEMDPDGIMEFAENECRVQVNFARPDGKEVEIDGFDFAKAQHLGRGGVVSTEWTAQMISAFKIMAGYYRNLSDAEKEKIYNFKAEYYLSQLGKMVITSPSPTGQGEGCLPYASKEDVDTGHGWRVAKGHRTGSVAATTYYIFAYKGHNPLSFSL